MKAIEVDNISKLYRLGVVSTGSLAHDVNRWWHRIRGKEDPYSLIAEANERDSKGSSDYVWSLKDLSFSLEEGEILGVIGKNGAGKSTLLKILSKVTGPTKGNIRIRGRVASLLEVGTGFHPDLTGRENMYLNGAILGMTKREISAKFDEIVAFSGVERYIDTPVKRYSSGMYVRLAFAVAAHLEPEILIVDEVLAVGDAEFQKKCLGKMKDVSKNEGRTVLFVSHNLPSIKQLCSRGIVLKSGMLDFDGSADDAVSHYLRHSASGSLSAQFEKPLLENKETELIKAGVFDAAGNTCSQFDISDSIQFKLRLRCLKTVPKLYGYYAIRNQEDEIIVEGDTFDCPPNMLENLSTGYHDFKFSLPPYLLGHGAYRFYFSLASNFANAFLVDTPGDILSFQVNDNTTHRGTRRKSKTSFLIKWNKSHAE